MTRSTFATIFCALAFVLIVPLAHAATSQPVKVNLFVTCSQNCGASTSTPTTTTPTSGNNSSSVTTGSAETILNVSGVTVGYQGETIVIHWQNPPGISGVRIMRSPYGVPLDPLAGQVIYQGAGTYTIDTSGTPGTIYYYTIFTYTTMGQYSSGAVFSVIWPTTTPPSPSQNQNQQQQTLPPPSSVTPSPSQKAPTSFPIISSFPPPMQASTTPITSVITSTTTATTAPITLGEILFIQNNVHITPATIRGALPLTIALPNNVVATQLPQGLNRAIVAISILGQNNYYLLRENSTDHALETSVDLSTAPAGEYPFSIEFWPNVGKPFTLSGMLTFTQATPKTAGLFGTGISFTNIVQILSLFVFLIVFVFLIRFAHRI